MLVSDELTRIITTYLSEVGKAMLKDVSEVLPPSADTKTGWWLRTHNEVQRRRAFDPALRG